MKNLPLGPQIGVAVIVCGRIGSLRAGLSSTHPGVRFLALSDRQQNKAEIPAQRTSADLAINDNVMAINHPEVDIVFVSTPEHDHREAIVTALEAGKPEFVEKPIALTLADAIIEAHERANTELRVGHSRRHERRWMMTKEQIQEGRLGEIIGIQSRVYSL